MRPAIASGIVTVYALVSYWPNFFPVPGNRSCESKLGPGFSSFLKLRPNWRLHSMSTSFWYNKNHCSSYVIVCLIPRLNNSSVV